MKHLARIVLVSAIVASGSSLSTAPASYATPEQPSDNSTKNDKVSASLEYNDSSAANFEKNLLVYDTTTRKAAQSAKAEKEARKVLVSLQAAAVKADKDAKAKTVQLNAYKKQVSQTKNTGAQWRKIGTNVTGLSDAAISFSSLQAKQFTGPLVLGKVTESIGSELQKNANVSAADVKKSAALNKASVVATKKYAQQKASVEKLVAATKTYSAESVKAKAAVLQASGRDDWNIVSDTKMRNQLVSYMTRATCAADSASDGYSNGTFPDSTLCPLEGAKGHKLRPSAARAYAAMNYAYAADHDGKQICITDSYRSYAAQVSVKARKGWLAAKPGTSNHGLGLAVDLCGGIERFNTPAYNWMKANAPLFGFVHPGWAEPSGSKPEPWHWEYNSPYVGGIAANDQSVTNSVSDEPLSSRGSANRMLAKKMAADAGWTGEQWVCLSKVWQQESQFNHLAKNPSSGAYGIPQSLPGSKMASAGSDWATNPATQVRWGISYIKDRYGNPCSALDHKYATGSGGKHNGWY